MLVSSKSLFASKTRFLMTVGGVALAILLILTLKGIEVGSLRQATIYVDKSKADVFVLQEGSQSIFQTFSILPRGMETALKEIEGVSGTTGVVQGATNFDFADQKGYLIYFGFDPETGIGGPWDVVQGEAQPSPGKVVLDQFLARKMKMKIGDTISIRNLTFEISGFSSKTATAVGSFAFFTKEDALSILRLQRVVGHFQVTLEQKEQAEAMARKIENFIPDVTAFSREEFRQNHLQAVRETLIPPMEVMAMVSLLIGTAIISLTIYMMTEARRREYGILKAIGVNNRQLYSIVFYQSIICALLGFFLGTALALANTRLVSFLVPGVEMVVEPYLMVKVLGLTFLMSVFSAWIPARLIAKVNPAIVFRE